jgi:SagB-type dehydrogenase family enzyme
MNTLIDSAATETLLYHEQTKHHFHRYAKSLGFLDWANQPNPFRFYEGVTAVRLPLLQKDPPAGPKHAASDAPTKPLRRGEGTASGHLALYERSRNVFQDFNRETIGAFLELSLGLSAWKSIPGSTWALRMNPSSGNLHPTEAHLILPALPEIIAGVFHYNSFLHALEPRAALHESLCQQITEHLHTDGFLVALTSIFWREAWKYGERAFRYCQHDVGHALAALSFSANLLGWTVTWLNEESDAAIAKLLGFNQTQWPEFEAEHPELLCFVHRSGAQRIPRDLPSEITSEFSELVFRGTPNQLSEDHVNWEIISRVAEATARHQSWVGTSAAPGGLGLPDTPRPFYAPTAQSEIPAAQIIRQRRSALAFDAVTSITKDQLCTMLDKTLPRNACAPFDLGLTVSCVHLLLFVHRVRGLEPGLYFLLRAQRDLLALQQRCHRHFLWNPVDEALPLYLLQAGDFQSTASSVSCGQSIAGDSAFSLGMIARFREELETAPCRYRHLFWETGMIGQVLYLEAEAHGVRATGIGCFFDDPVHELMGLPDDAFQSLYHFTVGGPREDARLATRAAYHHLEASAR